MRNSAVVCPRAHLGAGGSSIRRRRAKAVVFIGGILTASTLACGQGGAGPVFAPQMVYVDYYYGALSDLAVGRFGPDAFPDLLVDGAIVQNRDGVFEQPLFGIRAPWLTTAVADVTDDGLDDVISVARYGSSVGIRMQLPDGTLASLPGVPVGDDPRGCVVMDLDGDGVTDIATANCASADVSIAFGLGDGVFEPEQRVAVGGDPSAIRAVDLDRDGRPELVIVDSLMNRLTVLRAAVAGYAPAEHLLVGDAPHQIIDLDLDGDGWRDLALSHRSGTAISILRNDAAGFLLSPVQLEVGTSPIAIAAHDADRDGDPDLAVLRSSPPALVRFLNQGGTLQLESSIPLPDWPSPDFVVADLDLDGVTDYAILQGSSHVLVLNGRQEDDWAASKTFARRTPSDLALADLDGDGTSEFIVSNSESGDLTIVPPDFSDPPLEYLHVPLRPQAVAVLDVNGDLTPDIAAAGECCDPFAVLLASNVTGYQRVPMGLTGNGPNALSKADLNGDEWPDLVSANFDSNDVSVLLGQADGSFIAAPPVPVRSEPVDIDVFDLNGDGFTDLLVTCHSGYCSVCYGIGDGTFGAPTHIYVGSGYVGAGTAPRASLIAHLNDDDWPDVVVATYRPLYLGLAPAIAILLNDGATLGPPTWEVIAGPPESIATVDLDRDGGIDIVAAIPLRQELVVLRGNGIGGIASVQPLPISMSAHLLVSEDLDADGDDDLLAFSKVTDDALVVRNEATGLQPGLRFCPAADIADAVLHDMNGDGLLDIVAANELAGAITITHGLGGGTFGGFPHVPAGVRGASSVTMTHLDDDGLLDAIVAGFDSDNVAILYGRPGGLFAPPQLLGAGNGPIAVACGDLNRDGQQDFCVMDYWDGEISVFIGAGGRTFQPERRLTGTGRHSTDIELVDINRDGRLDLVYPSYWGRTVHIRIGWGNGDFSPVVRTTPAGLSPRGIAIADFNEDGVLDVATTSAIAVSLGNPDGTLNAPVMYGAGGSSIVAADFSGDGHLDLATTYAGLGVKLLLGAGDGTFGVPHVYLAEIGALVAHDFDADGRIDLAGVTGTNEVKVLRNRSESPPCRADVDENGLTDLADLLLYLDSWFAADPAANMLGAELPPTIDVFDLLFFLDDWFEGC